MPLRARPGGHLLRYWAVSPEGWRLSALDLLLRTGKDEGYYGLVQLRAADCPHGPDWPSVVARNPSFAGR